MPWTSFSENEVLPDGSRPTVWFAFDETRPLAFFAGIWTRRTSVRKVKEGETTNDSCESAPNIDPRQNCDTPLKDKQLLENGWGQDWTPIKPSEKR